MKNIERQPENTTITKYSTPKTLKEGKKCGTNSEKKKQQQKNKQKTKQKQQKTNHNNNNNKKKKNSTYKITDARTKKSCKRGIALERSIEKKY